MTHTSGFRGHPWRISYRTGSPGPDGQPVDILHHFYVPALSRATRYDRVAGYFRSTSLAAASQGFSAFVANEGHMRLVAGADLDPADVAAILDGDEGRLEAHLLQALQDGSWPVDVTRGVELLAWMVAQQKLDVRVACRVHAVTGEPIPYDSAEDGYVHMKWAVFTDAADDRLYITGSLNESKTALTRNAENIDVHCDWRGEDNRARADEAQADFQRIWKNRHPALKVYTLPEAVERRLVQLGERLSMPVEIDGTSAAPGPEPEPSALERLRFGLVHDGPRLPGGRFVGMETAPVEAWPHQAVVARRLIETWPASHLMCDEVGLGKTIEAGLAIRSLWLSGYLQRVLIAPPASLTAQWQREMATKFLLPFGRALGGAKPRHSYLLPLEEERAAKHLYDTDLAIVSTGLLTRPERLEELRKAGEFDVALVDEAHYARRANQRDGVKGSPRFNNLYKTVAQELRPRTKSLWLATATPMQIDPIEVADLVALTRRAGPFLRGPCLMESFYEILGELVRGGSVGDGEWELVRRCVTAVEREDPWYWDFLEKAVIDGRYRIATRRWLADRHLPRGGDRQGVLRLAFTAAPLSRVMLRHTRGLLELYREKGKLKANLAERIVLKIPRITFTEQERRFYDQLEHYCKKLAEMIEANQSQRSRYAMGFYLSFLRLRFASSLYAIRETLRRRLERVETTLAHHLAQDQPPANQEELADVLDEAEDDREAVETLLKGRSPDDLYWEQSALRKMLVTVRDLTGMSEKMRKLLEVLDDRRDKGSHRIRQTVVFTRFYDTLTDIVERLLRADPGMRVGTYSGQGSGGQYLDLRTGRLRGVEREEIKHRFLRGELDVLVCTDAAAEGLNLQTADLLVNFDLPWNPMKVEQRIGRIDRIGQRYEKIYVLNLCYADSAEHIVYGRLLDRLANANLIVGTQQLSMLPVTREEFAQLADGTLKEAALEKTARERAALAKRRTESMEIPPADLHEIYERLEAQASARKGPVDLDAIWETLRDSPYLTALGCTVRGDGSCRTVLLKNIRGVPDGTALTVSRDTFDRGLPDLEGRLHFATYGDPAFEAVCAQVAEHELPPEVRRLESPVPGTTATLVGYAVAARTGDGGTTPRLLTRVDELKSLVLAEGSALGEDQLAPLDQHLARLAAAEPTLTAAVPRIEALNERIAGSHQALALMAARGIILFRQSLGKADPRFWREAASIERDYAEKPELRVTRIDKRWARRLVHPLYPPVLPEVGDAGYVDAPWALVSCSVATACRVADGMRAKKSELSTDDVVSRLEREIEREVRGL